MRRAVVVRGARVRQETARRAVAAVGRLEERHPQRPERHPGPARKECTDGSGPAHPPETRPGASASQTQKLSENSRTGINAEYSHAAGGESTAGTIARSQTRIERTAIERSRQESSAEYIRRGRGGRRVAREDIVRVRPPRRSRRAYGAGDSGGCGRGVPRVRRSRRFWRTGRWRGSVRGWLPVRGRSGLRPGSSAGLLPASGGPGPGPWPAGSTGRSGPG
jgi:hypothetical protein